MKCEFKDGVKIDYSGSLSIRNGKGINGYLVRKEGIPDNLRMELDRAVRNDSCKEMRKITDAIVHGSPCGKMCLI